MVQIQVRPFASVNGLRFGIIPLEFGNNDFKLTPQEKDTLKVYSLVKESGGTRTVEPPTEITTAFYRFSIDAQFYPVEQILGTSNSTPLSPFVGAGLCFYRIWMRDAGEGLDDGSHSGFGLFANCGIEFGMGDDVVARIELLYGPTPDWHFRLLPELRPIEKGNYMQLKFGLGYRRPG